jgi:hypothetical protein
MKIGDKVRCIQNTGFLEVGKIYTIKGSANANHYIQIEEDGDVHNWHFGRFFKVVSQEPDEYGEIEDFD